MQLFLNKVYAIQTAVNILVYTFKLIMAAPAFQFFL